MTGPACPRHCEVGSAGLNQYPFSVGRTIVVAGPSAEVGFEWKTGDRGSPDPSASSSALCASASPRPASETADPAPSGSARAGPRARRPPTAQRLKRACGRQVSAPPPPPRAGRGSGAAGPQGHPQGLAGRGRRSYKRRVT